MKKDTVILLAEDDEGHAGLIIKNLKRAGVGNRILVFKNGEDILHFLSGEGKNLCLQDGNSCILLLDIRMPRIDGIEILQRLKQDETLRDIPVIIITTTDEPGTIQKCRDLGCKRYIVKPVDYNMFVETVRQLGEFLLKMDGDC
ncbi:MAG: response regulator [Deferribacteres bacterium]|nr:response regulator [Deferribacteres bacterium]